MARWYEDGRLHFAVGVEDTFVPQTRVGERSLDEYELTQHHHFWFEDLGRVADAGATMIRWGVPWYRVNPAQGRWDFSWLDRVVDRLDELGLDCIVDLMHYGTPTWLDNEFLNHAYPEAVATYAAEVAQRYRGRLRVFTPMNEPLLNAIYCGEFAHWPPYLRGDDGFVQLLRAVTRGMVLTQEAIARVSPEATFVNVEASYRFTGAVEEHADEVAFLRHRAFLVADLVTGGVGPDHPLVPYLARFGFTDADFTWYREHAVVPDVMGVNYYPAVSTEDFVAGADPKPTGDPRDPRPRVDSWLDGLEELMRVWHARYGRPVMLTETAHQGTVDKQVAWVDAAVGRLDSLRAEGLPIVGYTQWAVIDSVGWDYRYTLAPAEDHLHHSGLYHLRPDGAGVLQRVASPLLDAYRAQALAHR